MSRVLEWEGCAWARDLGGLPTADGRVTRHGSLVRADRLDELSERGWEALVAHGVRTIVDLRNDDERAVVPDRLPVVHVPLDAMEQRDFWDYWSTVPGFGTPEHYGPFLERFPHRVAAVMRAIAAAPPGAVVYHCVRGRDRTGLVTVLLLELARVPVEAIVADYELSQERPDGAGALIAPLLARLDVEAYLRRSGLRDAELTALRRRLVDEPLDDPA